MRPTVVTTEGSQEIWKRRCLENPPKSIREIGAETGYTPSTVHRFLNQHPCSDPPQNPPSLVNPKVVRPSRSPVHNPIKGRPPYQPAMRVNEPPTTQSYHLTETTPNRNGHVSYPTIPNHYATWPAQQPEQPTYIIPANEPQPASNYFPAQATPTVVPVLVGMQPGEPQQNPSQMPRPLDDPAGFIKHMGDFAITKMAYDQIMGQDSARNQPSATPAPTCTCPPPQDRTRVETLKLQTAQEERKRAEDLLRIEELRQRQERQKREEKERREHEEHLRAEFQTRQRAIEEERKRRAEETAAFTTAFIEQNDNTKKFIRSFDESIRAEREIAENRRAREDALFEQDRKGHALLLRKFDEVSGKIYDRSLRSTLPNTPGLCRSVFQNGQRMTSPAITQELQATQTHNTQVIHRLLLATSVQVTIVLMF